MGYLTNTFSGKSARKNFCMKISMKRNSASLKIQAKKSSQSTPYIQPPILKNGAFLILDGLQFLFSEYRKCLLKIFFTHNINRLSLYYPTALLR